MEKVKTPKCRSFHRRHKRPFAICVGVCTERNSDEVRPEESERGPDCPGEPFLYSDWSTDNITFPSCWMWQKVLITSTETV